MAESEFSRPDGSKGRGWLAEPTGVVRGNVVVVQEYWGLTDQIRGVCDRLASEGYRAFAPDLYEGYVAKTAEEAGAKMKALDFPHAVSQNVRGAAQHLASLSGENGGKVAVLGFCMGGAITLLSAAMVPEVSAAVCYYGVPPANAFDPSTIRVPVLGHFAQHDNWVTPAVVAELDKAMQKGNVPHTFFTYDAQHAFANERRSEVHDAAATRLAWERSLAFLQEKLA